MTDAGTRLTERDPGRIRVLTGTLRLTGPLFLARHPQEDDEAASAAYVDEQVSGALIAAAEVTEGGDLKITLANGSFYLAGPVLGPAGPAGATGPAGASGPAGPASVVGTAKGTWNASTNTPALSNGSGAQGDAYVVSVAGTTALDGISSWSVGDVALRGATAWGRVPKVDAGAFTQILLPKSSVVSTGGADGVDFADPYGEVILRLKGDRIIANGFEIGPDGPEFSHAALAEATIAQLTSADATLGGARAIDGGGDPGQDIADPYGEVLYRLRADSIQAMGTTLAYRPTQQGASWADPYGEVFLRATAAGEMEFAGMRTGKTPGAGIAFADPYGEVFAQWDATGLASGFAPDGSGGGAAVHSADEIAARNGENLAASATMSTTLDLVVARPMWKYNLFITYGQSLSAGSEGGPTLSRTAKWGNLMVGDKTTSVNNGLPGADNNNPAAPTWQVTGTAQFNPLVATDGVSAETVLHGTLNTFRRMNLRHRALLADPDRLMVGAGAAVGATNIAQLSKGASPDLFNRVPSLVAQAKAIATTAGGTFGVPGVLWLQGEGNQTTTLADYLTLLRQLVADLRTYIIAETGQSDPPGFYLYQTTQANWNFDQTGLGVGMAQLTAALNDTGVFMIGPSYPVPDSNNLHLKANGYRWLGSQFGKVLHRVMTLGQRWKPLHMRDATLRGREILIDFHVPYPPLVIDGSWLQTGWTSASETLAGSNSQVVQPDAGFSVLTTGGLYQAVQAFELVSPTQALITLFTAPSAGDLLLRSADGVHAGHASLRDSDDAVADDIWEHISGQSAADINPTLANRPYPLWNWVAAQQIPVRRL